MLRGAAALLLALHGVAHLPGFVVPWRLASLAELPYRTTALAGALDVGDVGARVVGLAWLAAALACWTGAAAALADRRWWPTLTIVVAIASSALCVLGWPDARLGLLMNAVLVALAAGAARSRALPTALSNAQDMDSSRHTRVAPRVRSVATGRR